LKLLLELPPEKRRSKSENTDNPSTTNASLSENTHRKSRYETINAENRTTTIYPTPKKSFPRLP
jgi:hypothetical protein